MGRLQKNIFQKLGSSERLNLSSTKSLQNSSTMAYQGPQKVQKVMVQPINLIFRFLQNRTRVQVWLYENVNTRIEGHIVGFDEYMNLVLDDAAEVHLKRGTMKRVGRVMLKGDNITLIQSMDGGKGAQAAGGPAN